eukprot:SAG22_NODE_1876_length_3387_cov_3.762470_1_plen_81_part_00
MVTDLVILNPSTNILGSAVAAAAAAAAFSSTLTTLTSRAEPPERGPSVHPTHRLDRLGASLGAHAVTIRLVTLKIVIMPS